MNIITELKNTVADQERLIASLKAQLTAALEAVAAERKESDQPR